ncbi:RHS repeat-associated core domain-containing protein [Corallococcus carmarthensis]|uniref:RHS repeat-associated core domain-containing protein n=1 Tax=Corallococcus carmarthensis TaxID=2316728 RepID=UPI0020A495CA|nr:RHS repeat-associated core domain-containing protein [Corallococcus carmarthensis]
MAHVELRNQTDGGVLSGALTATAGGRVWSPWVEPAPGRSSIVLVTTGPSATQASAGVVAEGYEYQKFQQGGQPYWVPLRFPGQYYDAETDLFENWNRYYDPGSGRYLQPEPMLQNPKLVAEIVMEGRSLPVYAYAMNNPVAFTDPNGLYPDPISSGRLCVSATCKKDDTSACHDLPEHSLKQGDSSELTNLPAPGSCSDSDAIYTDTGVIKIPNNCKCTLDCDENGTTSVSCLCFGFIRGPQEFDNNSQLPPGWPKNPSLGSSP